MPVKSLKNQYGHNRDGEEDNRNHNGQLKERFFQTAPGAGDAQTGFAAAKQAAEAAALDLKQNQRNVARGGISGIVNPERRDEAVMQSLARAFQEAQTTARTGARQTLQSAAGALTGAGGGLQPVAQTQLTVNQGNDKRRADLGQAIGAGLGSLGGILDSYTQQSPVPKPGQTAIQLA